MSELIRCSWADGDPLMEAYHDLEWGVPVHDDARLFELLTLEGAQAGLSWRTILAKRDGYRRVFAEFDPAAVARYTAADVDRLVVDPTIIRHRGKIEATVSNARALLRLQEQTTFDAYVWGFVDGSPLVSNRAQGERLPSESVESARLSRDLRRHGFRFVGPTTAYAFMQAAGLVDDHVAGCFRRA